MISTVLGFGSLLEISQNAPEKENENERRLTAGVSTKAHAGAFWESSKSI